MVGYRSLALREDELAEASQELDEPLIVGRLPAEHEHAVVGEQIPQLGGGLAAETAGREVGHLGADRIEGDESHLFAP